MGVVITITLSQPPEYPTAAKKKSISTLISNSAFFCLKAFSIALLEVLPKSVQPESLCHSHLLESVFESVFESLRDVLTVDSPEASLLSSSAPPKIEPTK